MSSKTTATDSSFFFQIFVREDIMTNPSSIVRDKHRHATRNISIGVKTLASQVRNQQSELLKSALYPDRELLMYRRKQI